MGQEASHRSPERREEVKHKCISCGDEIIGDGTEDRDWAEECDYCDEMSDLHVMPDDDRHSCSSECFCEPKLDYLDENTGKKVYVHKSPEELCQ